MHSLSVASRISPHVASQPFPSQIASKPHPKYPLKILPLEKACIFRPLMLHYKRSRLNRPLPA